MLVSVSGLGRFSRFAESLEKDSENLDILTIQLGAVWSKIQLISRHITHDSMSLSRFPCGCSLSLLVSLACLCASVVVLAAFFDLVRSFAILIYT